MDDSLIHLFENKPIKQEQPADAPKGEKGITIPLPFLLLFIPLLFISAGLSIPHIRTAIPTAETRFARTMMCANKAMNWDNFENAIKEKRGTAIGEVHSPKGLFRLSWTEDDIPAMCPQV